MNRRFAHPIFNSLCTTLIWASFLAASVPWTACPDVQAGDLIISPNSPSDYTVPPDLQQVQNEIDEMKRAVASGDLRRQRTVMERQSLVIHGATLAGTGSNSNQRNLVIRPGTGLVKTRPAPLTPIYACGAITAGGSYFLARDLIASGNVACLTISGVGNVHLNCQGHQITRPSGQGPVIQITDSNHSSIDSCRLNSPIQNEADVALSVDSSVGFSLTQSAVSGVNLTHCLGARILGNQSTGEIEVWHSSNTLIQSNRVDTGQVCTFGIYFLSGSGNQALGNTVDGHWNGDKNLSGSNCHSSDGGVFLYDQSGGRIDGNTLMNQFDSGIESMGYVSGMSMSYNTIINTGICAIGGYYLDGWENNTISHNRAENVKSLFDFYRTWGYTPRSPNLIFRNNSFSGNSLISALDGDYPQNQSNSAVVVPGYSSQDPAGLPTVENNVFKNNNFNANLQAPWLYGDGFVDGGGNLFGPVLTGANYYPLQNAAPAAGQGASGVPSPPAPPHQTTGSRF